MRGERSVVRIPVILLGTKKMLSKLIFKKNDSKLPGNKYLYLIVGHHWEILN